MNYMGDFEKKYLHEGGEVIAYKIGKVVYKYYKKNCSKMRLTEKDIEFLSTIKTKRILLPNDKLFDENNNFCGYKMKYIESKRANSFYFLPKAKLKSEMSFLNEDLEILSDNNILIDDLDYIDNTIYNNGLYLIDPGSYLIDKATNESIIFGRNLDTFNEYLIKCVIASCKNLSRTTKLKLFHDIFDEYIESDNSNIFEFFSNIEEDNLNLYIKNKVKIRKKINKS